MAKLAVYMRMEGWQIQSLKEQAEAQGLSFSELVRRRCGFEGSMEQIK